MVPSLPTKICFAAIPAGLTALGCQEAGSDGLLAKIPISYLRSLYWMRTVTVFEQLLVPVSQT